MTLDRWQQWEGRVIAGRYALQQYIGGSDHSAVYLTDFGGARAVAKLIPTDAPEAPVQLSRWDAACDLSHPNLLRVYETGRWHADDEQDMFFAVTEFADENLNDVLVERPLTAAETREMLAPTLAALEYLHGQNLVHGCLKPSNVLAVGPQLKLAIDGVRRSGTRLTSVEQEDCRAVPEVFNAGVSSRNDVWALGLLVAESLTRQKTKLEKTGDEAVQLPEDVAEPFRSIAQACLQRDPAKRCSIMEIRRMLERPTESAKMPPVVPIRSASQQDLVSQKAEAKQVPGLLKEETVSRPYTEPAHGSDLRRAVNLRPQLDESGPPQPRNWKSAPLAFAIVLAILAVFVLVKVAGRHTGETKSQPETSTPAFTKTGVQPTPAAASLATKSEAGAVAKQVMPEVSRVAQNSIHGAVKVRAQVNVNEAGEVTLAGLSAHGPSRYFARQALDAARQWTFTAPIVDGKPVATRWVIEFDFKRNGTKAESKMLQPKT